MQKATLIFLVTVVAIAITVPIFADEIPNPFVSNDTNSSANESGNNGTIDNSTLTNSTNSTNSTLTPEQLQTLTDTQSKLTALIATIEGLKTTYGNNTKAKGLLNALDQFEKQANKLNADINAFIQNPTAEDINGKINSFVKRTTALEHKVAVKQQLLAKLGTQTAKINKTKINKAKNVTKSKKNKGHNN